MHGTSSLRASPTKGDDVRPPTRRLAWTCDSPPPSGGGGRQVRLHHESKCTSQPGASKKAASQEAPQRDLFCPEALGEEPTTAIPDLHEVDKNYLLLLAEDVIGDRVRVDAHLDLQMVFDEYCVAVRKESPSLDTMMLNTIFVDALFELSRPLTQS